MKEFLVPVIVTIVIITFFYLVDRRKPSTEAVYVKSDLDDKDYLVRNLEDKEEAAYMLSLIKKRVNMLKEHLNIKRTPEFIEYINQFDRRIENFVLTENAPDGTYTSYTVNKGDEIALCLRSRKDGKLHDINLVMYVVLHELAHVACPEIDHTPLFKKIFIYFLKEAEDIGIYVHTKYDISPQEYCGITISENLLE